MQVEVALKPNILSSEECCVIRTSTYIALKMNIDQQTDCQVRKKKGRQVGHLNEIWHVIPLKSN